MNGNIDQDVNPTIQNSNNVNPTIVDNTVVGTNETTQNISNSSINQAMSNNSNISVNQTVVDNNINNTTDSNSNNVS